MLDINKLFSWTTVIELGHGPMDTARMIMKHGQIVQFNVVSHNNIVNHRMVVFKPVSINENEVFLDSW